MSHDITSDAARFFADLEKDNTKVFWSANKARYEKAVRDPFAAVLHQLEDEWGPFKVFRMNRDVRFSADKSPYKTMRGAVSKTSHHHYLHIDKAGILIVAGAYMFTKDQLSTVREKLVRDADAGQFLSVVADLKTKGIDLDQGGAAPLKTAPRGFDPAHPMIEYLRWNGMMATKRVSVDEGVAVVQLAEDVSAFWRTTGALVAWMR